MCAPLLDRVRSTARRASSSRSLRRPRDPARGQGPLRHRGARDDLRLAALRRARPEHDGGRRLAARGRRIRRRRQDEPARVRVRNDLGEPALRRRPEPARRRSGRRRVERWKRSGARSRRGRPRARYRLGRLDPDPLRLLRHRRLQADVRPRLARGLLPARAELRPRGADGARRRDVHRRDGGARSGSGPRRSTRSPASASAWRGSTAPRRSSGRGSRRQPNVSRSGSSSSSPGRRASVALFMHEVADVHRELFAENADLYGEDLRIKLERCLAVTDAEAETARRSREEYRERMEDAVAGVDLVVTPTLPVVAPRIGEGAPGDIGVREALVSRTFPFNALGWPALALPCGTAEDGLPASVQIVGRAGADALVLAAGLALETVLSGWRNSTQTASAPRFDSIPAMRWANESENFCTPSRSRTSTTSRSRRQRPRSRRRAHEPRRRPRSASPDGSVVLEGLDRLERHRVHGVWADQLVDVEDVAVGRVLRRGRRPQAALDACALGGEPLPALAGERLLVVDVGELGVRDRELPARDPRRPAAASLRSASVSTRETKKLATESTLSASPPSRRAARRRGCTPPRPRRSARARRSA